MLFLSSGNGDMTQLSDVSSFVTLSRAARSLRDLDGLVDAIRHEMGFDFYAVVQHVDVRKSQTSETVWLENYPASWAESFVAQGFYATDPIHIASQRTSAGFVWSDVGDLVRLTANHKRILAHARAEGMGEGFTVPAHIPGESNGTCSFSVRVGQELPVNNLMMAQLVGTFAFEAGRRLARDRSTDDQVKPKLTQRQLDCVIFVSRGKSDWEIAQILGIKEATVRDYVEEACERYGVRRRVQLIVRVLHDGHLTLRDAIG